MEPKRRGLALLIVGLVLMILLAPAAFFGGIGVGAYRVVQAVSDAPIVQAGGTRHFNQGDKAVLLPMVGTSSSDSGVNSGSTDVTAPECSVTAPDGQSVAVTSESSGTTVDKNRERFAQSGSFTAATAGDYTIDCSGQQVMVLDDSAFSAIGGKMVLPLVIGTIVASIVGITGLVLTIVGGVKLSRSGKERTAWRAQNLGYQGNYGVPQQGYPRGQQGQPGNYVPPQQGYPGQQQGYPGQQQRQQPGPQHGGQQGNSGYDPNRGGSPYDPPK